ncbi:hypothetical protein BGZ97_009609, partial [Linnemannia gamsii]
MGAATSFPNPFSKKPLTSHPSYIITGLSGAGKSTILHRFKFHLYITCSPSISENIETVEFQCMHKRVKRVFNLVDLTEGSGRALRENETWRTQYRQHLRGIIFVVDSADHDPLMMEQAAERLLTFLHEEVEGTKLLPLLVLANKQDSPTAMTVAEIKDSLRLEVLPGEQVWHIMGVSAMLDEGLTDGLEWL